MPRSSAASQCVGRQLERAVVDEAVASPQVRMRAGAVRGRPVAAVVRGDRDLEAVVRAEPVPGPQFQAERVTRPPEQPQPQLRAVGPDFDQLPAGPAGEPVDGVAVGRLGQVELVGSAVEGVPAAVDPVRPRRQQLAGSGGRQLVRAVFGDDRVAPVAEGTQARPEFGNGGQVVPGGDVVLRSGERDAQLSHAP